MPSKVKIYRSPAKPTGIRWLKGVKSSGFVLDSSIRKISVMPLVKSRKYKKVNGKFNSDGSPVYKSQPKYKNNQELLDDIRRRRYKEHLQKLGLRVPDWKNKDNTEVTTEEEANDLIVLNLPMLIGRAFELALGIHVPDPDAPNPSPKWAKRIKPDPNMLKFLIELGLGKAVSRIQMNSDGKSAPVINLFIPDNSRNDVTETIRKSLPPAPRTDEDNDYEIIDVEFDAHDS